MSERFPPATGEDHDRFCEREGWALVRGATGRPVRHHRTYELGVWDGRILRTRVSQPVDRTDYSASMWSHILRNQLDVTAETFWSCAEDGALPDRGAPRQPDTTKAVPLFLRQALNEMGVDDATILGLGPAGAASLLASKYVDGQSAEEPRAN